MTRPFISLLSDFGARDPSGAIMKGVVLGIAPEANVVDISHEVDKYAVRDGALLLWCALPFLPVGSHVAVVDPGVGTERRPLAIRVGRGDVLIGPDNGLLLPAAERLGGIIEVRALENPAYRLARVSASFHGRDVFAPAAAHLAAGAAYADLGSALPLDDLVQLSLPGPRIADGVLETAVVYVDTFGNVKLGALAADLVAALGPLRPGDPLMLEFAPGGDATLLDMATWEETFGRVAPGEPLVYEDSYGRLCLADNRGDAASRLGLAEDVPVSIRRA